MEQHEVRTTANGAVDEDPTETREWLDSLESVARVCGSDRALFLLRQLEEQGQQLGLIAHVPPFSAYRNTIPLERQGAYPGDLAMEERITSINRWNALAMVVRANAAYGELGGHIASYASAAEIFEVGFNHFFRGADETGQGGDLVFFQPHSAPGVYARAYLEGRLTEEQLTNYRQEVAGNGLCSYPHPWLMPEFWQFPTGSMGLGPISAVYQARFLRYLRDRGLSQGPERHVWGVFGDGEMDEPESVGALTLAVREGLDNLAFVINCNLQRLDGPVRGNGQIIQELESLFAGAGWNVVKVLWGSNWDQLFALDRENALLRGFAATVDGKYQTLGAKDGRYNLENFFGQNEELKALVAHMSEREVDALRRGGHDLRKLYAAFAAAKATRGRPTVILAKTKKGFGMGAAGESRNTAHQAKKLDVEALQAFRDRFALPISDADVAALKFFRPAEDSPELTYLRERRAALGGALPARRTAAPVIAVPPLASYGQFALQADGKEMSTTMAAVRLFGNLLRDKTLGPRIVPIVADEARTFGMSNMFRQVGIYSPVGQLYEPEDAGSMLYYKEARDGQLLEEGITEAGAMASWTAAATAYSVSGTPMLPFYIYYSMFGFQRVGDLIWAAADQRARGFLLGATAGRTTLGGEGLQHQDGSSHVVAATVPNCKAYDPAFAYELAVIMDRGMRAMMEGQADEFYYVTVLNENYAQPSLPAGAEEGIIRGLYRLRAAPEGAREPIRLVGSGAILREVIAAADLLETDWDVAAEVFSATSFSELDREARAVERWNRLHPEAEPRTSHLAACLPGRAPVIAATDYVRAYPQLIAPYVEGRFVALGTAGSGAATRAPSCAASSRSTARRSCSPRSPRSPQRGGSTARSWRPRSGATASTRSVPPLGPADPPPVPGLFPDPRTAEMNSVNPVPRSATRPWPSGRAAPLPKPATGARPPMPARRSGVWRAVSASISDASPVWGRTAASSRTTCGPSSGPINAPEVAIFGVAKAATRPHWNGHELLPRPILPHSLSWDHWAVDGVAAGRFLAHLADLLGDPRRLLL